ncbi:MAG: PhoH family protein [Candidatus Omnitrophica bacterium]|nr:PhoH family protein [Candidatus Omnitrophota bacterium]
MSSSKEIVLTNHEAQVIFGKHDENLRLLEDFLGVEIFARGNVVRMRGEQIGIEKARKTFENLRQKMHRMKYLTPQDILDAMPEDEERKLHSEKKHQPTEASGSADSIVIGSRKESIFPRSVHQRSYIRAIRKYSLTVGIGPAGTGKTYLAVALAIESLRSGLFSRVILTRPALEAGERLGFLPGDLEEKIKPYLQPIYDALFDLLRYEELKRWSERKIIEIIPLAYMRGRTLNDAFIILDEAQNTTGEQMKMFLTRLGSDSKAVVTGDTTQIDLPLSRETSGLVICEKVLSGVKGVRFVYFNEKDVVRHPLVKRIIKAYESHYRPQPKKNITDRQTEKNQG